MGVMHLVPTLLIMSISMFKDKDFEVDLKADPVYGVLQIPVAHDLHEMIEFDVKKNGVKEKAKTNSDEDNSRQVSLWRIPIKTHTGGLLKNIIKEANKIFNYKICAIQDIQYLEYNVGDYYKMHTDISNDLGSMRKISFSWILNENFEGGELNIYNGGEKHTVVNKNNFVTAFTSFFTHEVTPVTKGKRKVLVCWANGDSWR